MAVISCKLQGPRNATFGLKNQRTATLTYKIQTNTARSAAMAVKLQAQAAGPDALPVEYGFYNAGGYIDLGVYCTSISMVQDGGDDHLNWTATATFGPLPDNQTPLDMVINPLQRPNRYWTESLEIVRPVEKDINGRPIRNAAGQEFIDPIMEEENLTVLCVQKNMANLQDVLDLNADYGGRLNEKTFFGGEAKTWKCGPIVTGPIMYENGFSFYSPVIRLFHNPDTWLRRIVNQGFQHYNNVTDKKLVRAVDDNGEPTTEPVLLKADGTKLAAATIGNLLDFETRLVADFNNMGL